MTLGVYLQLFWQLLLLLAIAKLYNAVDHRGVEYRLADDEFQLLFVTKSGDVIVHQRDSLLQFENGDISESSHRVTRQQSHESDKPMIARSFDHNKTPYMLICHMTSCRVNDASNINISYEVGPYKVEDAVLQEKTSAQLVFPKLKVTKDQTFVVLFSAVTDPNGTCYISYTRAYFDLITTSQRVELEIEKRFQSKESVDFDYVFSFDNINTDGQNVYFVRNVVEADGQRKVMLSEMCATDQHLRSYIETELTCATYNRVVSATVIVDRYLALVMEQNAKTALCVFDIQTGIEEHFNTTLKDCYRKQKGSWPPWIQPGKYEATDSCSKESSLSTIHCGNNEINRKILSTESLETNAITKLAGKDVVEHSMVFRYYGGAIYGYIGLRSGNIWKVIFNEQTKLLILLSSVYKASTPIRQLAFSNDGTSLFFISNSTLGKLRVDPTCPLTIEDVQPMSGPLLGGTKLTLTGNFNFGSYEKTTSLEITIGNVSCLKVMGNTDNRITCVTPAQNVPGKMPIKVEIENLISGNVKCNGTSENDYSFVYMEPTLNSSINKIQTTRLSGCVPISVYGDHLDIGTSRQMLVGEQSCQIIFNNRSMVSCLAPEQLAVGNYTITVKVDNMKLTGPIVTYIQEPNITHVEPHYTFVSGDTKLTIIGDNLEGMAGADMRLQINRVKSNVCELKGSSTSLYFECITPDISSVSTIYSDQLVFLSNDDCSNVPIDARLLVIPDPVFKMKDQQISDMSEIITVHFKGSNLTHIRKADVNIYIGNDTTNPNLCEVVDIHNEGINCTINRKFITGWETAWCVMAGRRFYLGLVSVIHTEITRNAASKDDTNYTGIIIGVLFPGICVICVAVYIGRRIRRNQQRRYNARYNSGGGVLSLEGLSESHVSESVIGRHNEYLPSTFLRTVHTNPNECNPVITSDLNELLDQSQLLIPKENLVMGEVIGQGNFGCVYKGYLQAGDEKTERIVACKTMLRTNPEDLDVDVFLKEALVMKDFHHKNVMDLIGICLGIQKLPVVVLPFMQMGDLLSYIRDVNNIPTVKQLVIFAVDIANGMEYLAQLKFVHRDLAARNCMIDDERNVKVADFGLSRDVYEKEYYTSCDKKAKLPVKWMSPESLEFGKYTSKSDVWSFGVLMWELLTRGVNPYPTVDGWDILRYLKTGRRLEQPEFCPDEMYRIVQACWEWEPDNRPTFSELTTTIPELLRRLERASERKKLMSTRSEEHDGTAEAHDVTTKIHDVTAEPHGVTTEIHDITAEIHGVTTEIHDITAEMHDVTAEPHGVSTDIGKGLGSETKECGLELETTGLLDESAIGEQIPGYINKEAIIMNDNKE